MGLISCVVTKHRRVEEFKRTSRAERPSFTADWSSESGLEERSDMRGRGVTTKGEGEQVFQEPLFSRSWTFASLSKFHGFKFKDSINLPLSAAERGDRAAKSCCGCHKSKRPGFRAFSNDHGPKKRTTPRADNKKMGEDEKRSKEYHLDLRHKRQQRCSITLTINQRMGHARHQ